MLDHESAKKLGLRTYDDLVLWLRKNDPDSLELGRKCIAAFEACGYLFEDDWIGDKWGFTPDRAEYSQAYLAETSYEAAFVSPWGAPEEIFRVIARRHTGLTSRFTALEEGNDYTFLLTTSGGIVTEEQLAVTDRFIDEMDGPGEVDWRIDNERAFYEQPSTLRARSRSGKAQLDLFAPRNPTSELGSALVDTVRAVDINRLTPLDALQLVAKLKTMIPPAGS